MKLTVFLIACIFFISCSSGGNTDSRDTPVVDSSAESRSPQREPEMPEWIEFAEYDDATISMYTEINTTKDGYIVWTKEIPKEYGQNT